MEVRWRAARRAPEPTEPMTFYATYALPVLLGLIVLFAFPLTRHMRDSSDRQRYWIVQGCVLLGALAGAKVVALMGDFGWPLVPLEGGVRGFLNSGRSIVGGLLGGWAAGELAKPLVGYKLPPNDRFAAVLPFSIAIGRLGCHLTGCCAGLPHEGLFSVRDHHGVSRWPTQLMEVAFQLTTGLVFMALVRRRILHARLFSVYLALYGTYRFATEFLRDTPRAVAGLSVYQVLCVPMIALGVGLTVWRTLRPPPMPAPQAEIAR
ncbi:MAG: prolipoprotein diacylglyceryl transferase family protein [Polyangiales bacterium]